MTSNLFHSIRDDVANADRIAEIGFYPCFNEKSCYNPTFKLKAGQTPTNFREEIHTIVS